MPVKTKTALSQTELNTVKQTPYLELDSEIEKNSNAEILKGKAVIIIDPVTGKALGASDFLSKTSVTFEHQADVVLSQANPVSATLYAILATTTNVRIISISDAIDWAVTQPTLVCTIIVDSNTISATKTTPVNNADHFIVNYVASANFTQDTTQTTSQNRAFLLEGRSVAIYLSSVWAITQPTLLAGRVKYAKR